MNNTNTIRQFTDLLRAYNLCPRTPGFIDRTLLPVVEVEIEHRLAIVYRSFWDSQLVERFLYELCKEVDRLMCTQEVALTKPLKVIREDHAVTIEWCLYMDPATVRSIKLDLDATHQNRERRYSIALAAVQ